MGERGPEQIEFNLDEIERLCRLNCTNAEIAAFFNVSERTIDRRLADNPEFFAAVERGRNYGRLSLRRKQIEVATGGNPTMLIWLGKQYLGQRDKSEIENTRAINLVINRPEREEEQEPDGA